MISNSKIKAECRRLEKSIKENKKRIAKMPKGRLQCHRDKNNWNWYVVDDNSIKTKTSAKEKTADACNSNEFITADKHVPAQKAENKNDRPYEAKRKYLKKQDEILARQLAEIEIRTAYMYSFVHT